MLVEFIKSVIVGICAAAPLGPVAALVIQKTLLYGRKTGFVTGCGSGIIDILYASIGVFALGLVDRFLVENSSWISLLGGAIVCLVGILMLFRDPFKKLKQRDERIGGMSPSYPLQAALFSIANPGALVLMLGLVALFGIGENKTVSILGVSTGVVSWWFLFSYIIARFGKKFNINALVLINKILGAAVAIFGVIWIIKAL